MNKKVKTVLIIVGVLAALLFAIFAKPSKGYKTINYDEYKELSEPSIVYIGTNKKLLDAFKDLNVNSEYSINYLNYSKLSDSQRKGKANEVVEIWKDGKLVKDYKFDAFTTSKNGSGVINIDIDEYYKLKDTDGLHFLLVGREGCGYCQMFNDVIKELHEEYKIVIYYLDTDSLDQEGYDMLYQSDEYFQGSWGTPTSVIYYNGEKIDLIGGYLPLEELTARLDNIGLLVFLKENKVI